MFLRKFSRPSMMMMMSARAKESSSPVGELIKVYKKTIDEIVGIPEDEGYRKALEATTRERLNICLEEENNAEAIENRIGCGKIDEILQDAKFEYKVVSSLLEWDPWGTNKGYMTDILEHCDPVPTSEPSGPVPDELYERLKDLAKVTPPELEPIPHRDQEPDYEDQDSDDATISSVNNH